MARRSQRPSLPRSWCGRCTQPWPAEDNAAVVGTNHLADRHRAVKTSAHHLGVLRIVLGWYFLWAFIDKVFGFGFLTAPGKGMIDGGSPAQGFMTHAEGPFAGLFNSIAGPWADYAFMLGLLAIGIALITGCGLKLTATAAVVLLAFMYLAEFPLGADAGTYTNPLTDDHWVDALAIIAFWFTRAGDTFGLGRWWGGKVGDSWLR